ncbi:MULTISPECIES: MarR family transcriptional regulator [unclassified Thalassospira]|uniref:MarR family transcriptional regulator n=1 Tax=unclassified Thalassospira TaxID=2648997 RepID=UPI0025D5F826|nr:MULTISPECIES: helix-turn-helix domain-containing protein [unclassified Thalassospira]|tara:strand:+ start:5474 stop:6994 length:1521 start_codon:yes stop_codon:yes gene_type:complete
MHGSEQIEIDTYEVLLPTRNYRVVASVASQRKLALHIEFCLMLLKNIGWVTVKDIQRYFGYSADETSVLIQDLLQAGYVEEHPTDSGIQLTRNALALFESGSDGDTLRITEIKEIERTVPFDSISLSLSLSQGRIQYGRKGHMRALEELPPDSAKASQATKTIRDSFEHHFTEFNQRYGDDKATELYSIDAVEPLQMGLTVLSLPLVLKLSGEPVVEPDLSLLHEAGQTGQSRRPIIDAVTRHLSTKRWPSDSTRTFEFIRLFERQQLNQFLERDSFNLQAFAKLVLAKRRPSMDISTRFIGSTTTDAFLDAYVKLEEDMNCDDDDCLLWFAPNRPLWGVGQAFEDTVDRLRNGANNKIPTFLIKGEYQSDYDKESRLLRKRYSDGRESSVFTNMVYVPVEVLPSSLEVIIRPGKFAAVIVHIATGGDFNIPVPVGFMTTDASFVADLHLMVSQPLSAKLDWFNAGGSSTRLHDIIKSTTSVRRPETREERVHKYLAMNSDAEEPL